MTPPFRLSLPRIRPRRSAVAAALLLLALAPTGGEATTRMSFSIAKSFHPETERDYSTVHPGLGATGRLVGQWLRWRTGLVRHSHRRVGPYAGVAATWQVCPFERAFDFVGGDQSREFGRRALGRSSTPTRRLRCAHCAMPGFSERRLGAKQRTSD